MLLYCLLLIVMLLLLLLLLTALFRMRRMRMFFLVAMLLFVNGLVALPDFALFGFDHILIACALACLNSSGLPTDRDGE